MKLEVVFLFDLYVLIVFKGILKMLGPSFSPEDDIPL